MKVAVIGSGISGLISSYLLQRQHQVTLFEANDYLGGHTATIDVQRHDQTYAIDTGFIVFNNKTYPNFIKFLKQIDVQWQDTEMSFSVFDRQSNFEYNGNNLNALFSQRKHLLSPKFYQFLYEILRFNKLCKNLYDKNQVPLRKTLGEFLDENKFSLRFRDYYLLPMVAAIWSSTYKESSQFSLQFFIRFFINHGLLNVNDRPQWHVLQGGSREYIRALLPHLNIGIRLNNPVKSIYRQKNSVRINSGYGEEVYDHVILACHSDQALRLLKDKSDNEAQLLAKLKYQKNQVTLHTDTSLLPQNPRAWASWNYRIVPSHNRKKQLASVSYNMNILQGIRAPETFIVSLNQDNIIDERKILRKFSYDHPVFNDEAEEAKKNRLSICGQNKTHFCGAYWYNGFHEDGVRSALDVARRFGIEL